MAPSRQYHTHSRQCIIPNSQARHRHRRSYSHSRPQYTRPTVIDTAFRYVHSDNFNRIVFTLDRKPSSAARRQRHPGLSQGQSPSRSGEDKYRVNIEQPSVSTSEQGVKVGGQTSIGSGGTSEASSGRQLTNRSRHTLQPRSISGYTAPRPQVFSPPPTKTHRRLNRKLTLLILGQTGSGKSSSINQLLHAPNPPLGSGSVAAEVGHNLGSCTSQPAEYLSEALAGYDVNLIDSPGFDDTHASDAEIVTVIADFLNAHRQRGRFVDGVLFFHRITDVRLSAASVRAIGLLKHLCGKAYLPRVALVTNMWSRNSNISLSEDREQELLQHPQFWGGFPHSPHSLQYRHWHTPLSAWQIVSSMRDHLMGFELPKLLRVQAQMALGTPALETDAGRYLLAELAKEQARCEDDQQMKPPEARITATGRDVESVERPKIRREISTPGVQRLDAPTEAIESARLFPVRRSPNVLNDMRHHAAKSSTSQDPPLLQAGDDASMVIKTASQSQAPRLSRNVDMRPRNPPRTITIHRRVTGP